MGNSNTAHSKQLRLLTARAAEKVRKKNGDKRVSFWLSNELVYYYNQLGNKSEYINKLIKNEFDKIN